MAASLSIFMWLLLTAACALAIAPTQDGLSAARPKAKDLPWIAIRRLAPVHDGGFIGGTSKNGSEAYCADFLAPAGHSVFSINHRLAPQYPYPAMVEDVETAIRYIRVHATERKSDPDKIALLDGSAGPT